MNRIFLLAALFISSISVFAFEIYKFDELKKLLLSKSALSYKTNDFQTKLDFDDAVSFDSEMA